MKIVSHVVPRKGTSSPFLPLLHFTNIGDGDRSVRLLSYSQGLLRGAAICAMALFCCGTAQARINVVTLPERDKVQLTIYNSVDLTLVKETRHLTFRKGLNKLEFSWANTLIDPTSVEFKALTHADEVEVLDVSFPPRVTNTLEWRIHSEVGEEVTVEIRYFTSGIRWSAEYLAEAAPTEKLMNLSGQVRVTNNSGEDYENAQVRLVVGVIRLVEEIAKLARQEEAEAAAHPVNAPAPVRLSRALAAFDSADREAAKKPKDIVKEALSEYFLYSVEGRDTIPNGWSKRLPSFRAQEVPLTSYYKYEKEFTGDDVRRFYRFTNSTPSNLGKEPLPDGAVTAFRVTGEDALYAFIGRTAAKYIPVDEKVELELGRDQEVLVKPTLLNWEKKDVRFDARGNVRGWTVTQLWQFEVQNSKEIDAVLDIRRNFSGDWSLSTATAYEKVDANKIKFVLPLKARQKQTFRYELTTRYGTNATK
jgi:hypothetical protein